jgi:hypothetical protein
MTTKKKNTPPSRRKADERLTLEGRFVRINAVGREDRRHVFSLLSRLRPDGRIDGDIESYGSIVDIYLEDGSWITSIFKLTNHNATGRIYYGDQSFEDGWTNIYTKQIELGELFTVHYDLDDPSADIVFQIDRITPY